jgi:hypothetical protein
MRKVRKRKRKHYRYNKDKILKLVLFIFVALYALSYYFKGLPRDINDISPMLRQEPTQKKTSAQSFDVLYKNRSYNIDPVYEYDISGLVVSRNNTEGFGDIYHDENSFDTIDVCVIWGGNVMSTDFNKMEFWNVSWTCNWKYPAGVMFNNSEISNNHLITNSDLIREKFKDIRVGDQIRIKGKLVNYKMNGMDFVRKTSTKRTDTGNKACEIIFVEDFKTIKRGTPFWYFINKYSFYVMIIFLILYLHHYINKDFITD